MTMTVALDDLNHRRRSFNDLYFLGLLSAIAAYATTGRGFAYAGVPPLFPGEVILALGLVTLLRPRPSPAVLCNGPVFLLMMMIGWTLWRTLPFIGAYQIDALRDSVVVIYGLFAIVTANLILEKPERITDGIGYAGRFFAAYAAVIVVLYLLQKYFQADIPNWPNSGEPILHLRGGEIAVHLSGAAVFALLGFKRSSPFWIIMLVSGVAVAGAQSRGGLLSVLVPLLAATFLAGRFRPALLLLAIGAPIILALYLTDIEIKLPANERAVQIGQLLENVSSIVTSSGNEALDGTKLWRLRWWDAIIEYTVHGDYFWTGKGFGINLAESDGFVVSTGDGPPLRSPHSVHMTILARTGVPGIVLWAMINASWFWMMLRNIYQAHMSGDTNWAKLFVFVACYLLAALINSSFDVAIEGPMIGIMFWVLFGAGVGLSMTYAVLRRERGLPRRQPGIG